MSGKENKSPLSQRIKDCVRMIIWIFAYSRKRMWMIAVYTLLGMSGAVVSILAGLKSKDVVDIITNHRTGELLTTFGWMLFIQLLSVFINSISVYFSTYIRTRVENDIKEDIFSKIISTRWEELNNFSTGQIMSRWNGDCVSIASGLLTSIPNAIIFSFRFISSLYMVLIYDASFAIFALCSIPLSYLVSYRNMKRMRKYSMEGMEMNAEMTGFTQDALGDIQTIKALDMVKLYKKKLHDLQGKNTDVRMKNQRVSTINSIVLVLVSQLIYYSTYGWGIYRVWSGFISYGTMTMFLTLSQSLNGAAQNLINMIPSTVSLANAAYRVREISELPKEDMSGYDEVTAFGKKHENDGVGISVDEVSFAYKSGKEVFNDASFVACPGETVGLVGPSGGGKTTMLRLILAIIDAGKGEAVLVSGGKKPEKMDITAASRQLFSYVPQGNTMLRGTIADNMRNVREDATDEEIIEALKMADAWDFVKDLPDGINYKLKEHGGGMSEGQSQRLSIARALLRKTPVLLLDEATSALDIDTQKRVLDNIMGSEIKRTIILTTHRPEVMDICDRVYTIKDTEVKEKESG